MVAARRALPEEDGTDGKYKKGRMTSSFSVRPSNSASNETDRKTQKS